MPGAGEARGLCGRRCPRGAARGSRAGLSRGLAAPVHVRNAVGSFPAAPPLAQLGRRLRAALWMDRVLGALCNRALAVEGRGAVGLQKPPSRVQLGPFPPAREARRCGAGSAPAIVARAADRDGSVAGACLRSGRPGPTPFAACAVRSQLLRQRLERGSPGQLSLQGREERMRRGLEQERCCC